MADHPESNQKLSHKIIGALSELPLTLFLVTLRLALLYISLLVLEAWASQWGESHPLIQWLTIISMWYWEILTTIVFFDLQE